MSISSTNDQNLPHIVRQDSSTNERIMQWIQQVEHLQTCIMPPTEEIHIPSSETILPVSQAQIPASILLHMGMDSVVEDIVLMATTRIAGLLQRLSNCSLASELDRPSAPIIPTIPLPQVQENIGRMPTDPSRDGVSVSLQYGLGVQRSIPPCLYRSERRSDHRLYHPPPSMLEPISIVNRPEQARVQWDLNPALRYHESIRPVVEPVLSDMPPYPGHRWGALDQDGSRVVGELNIHFACNITPATNPPLTRIRLARPFGGRLTVTPTAGSQFVSVSDVQKIVVAWMRWEQPHVQDENLQMTRSETARARNGTTMNVEVWVWRGLKSAIGEADVWEINL